jgi:hypothetical protein
MPADWPRCAESITAFYDVMLTCVLPRGHECDGPPTHRDATGAEWMWVDDETRWEQVG